MLLKEQEQKEVLIEYWKNSKIITDKRVIEVFREVPREDFLPKELKKEAYDDNALPLFEGQTISQPTTVMIMTQALEVKEGDKILEIGTASGYQSALLSLLAGEKGKVITTEIVPRLYGFGKNNLKNYKNVKVILSDGSLGYEKEAPYDRIIVTCACKEIPPPLLEQLKDNGVLVVPVGSKYVQQMIKVKKIGKRLENEYLGDFVFVQLVGRYGWKD